ncbi:MAG TPA: nucleotidyl transferase AbiEii/AbiGii toxin family protein [Egibacteraceae bacterium]|nr:nucleotidyl transferase AbiEii/AbiGii toxin family protein [Egibacteraceae bacterium]
MSDRLADVLREVAAALNARGVRFALVGGLAVSVRTEPRFTRDVDLAVAAADDRGAEAVVGALAPRYEPVAVLEHEALERLAAVRLARAGQSPAGVVVDLLFASSGVEQEMVETAEPLEVFTGTRLHVARTGHLLALKVLARDDRRPQDEVDLQALLSVAGADDLVLAEEMLQLIVRRGANRGRQLVAEWKDLVRGHGDATAPGDAAGDATDR